LVEPFTVAPGVAVLPCHAAPVGDELFHPPAPACVQSPLSA
jgi:hypothetical protein